MSNVRLLKVNRRENNFVRIDKKSIAFNKKMSWKAKGILTALLSLKDGQDFNLGQLSYFCNDGVASTESGVKELKTSGHLEVCRWRESTGKFGWGFNVYDEPLEFPVTKFSIIDNPNNVSDNEPVNVESLATQFNVSKEVVEGILKANQQSAHATIVKKPVPTKEQKTDFEQLKKEVIENKDFAELCKKEYNLNDFDFVALRSKFFEQSQVLTPQKPYDYEGLKKHLFNWLGVHLKKKGVVKQPKQEAPPQYFDKEKTFSQIGIYKKMMLGVTHAHSYTYFREAVKGFIKLAILAKENNALDEKQINYLQGLELKFNTAGRLKEYFIELQTKNSNEPEQPNEKVNITDALKNLSQNFST
jgi:hypothetical protein